MKVIITFTVCCDNLWRSKFMAVEMALEKPGKLREFFLLRCDYPVKGYIQCSNIQILWLAQQRHILA